MAWLDVFRHLLPTARAWRLTPDKTLRKFFDGLAQGVPSDAKENFDNIYQDLDPVYTRALSLWEDQFALFDTGLDDAGRRSRLSATWKAQGGQDPRYIQDTLQAAGFDVYVHEWWEPNPTQPLGGSVNGDVVPVVRDPFDYLDDGQTAIPFAAYDSAADMQDGDTVAQDGGTNVPVGYPLVNKLLETSTEFIGDGSPYMQEGDPFAQDGSFLTIYSRKEYIMPIDPDTFFYYLYIGGETFPEQAVIPQSRKEEFEDLCLKICPLEQWLGIIVAYN